MKYQIQSGVYESVLLVARLAEVTAECIAPSRLKRRPMHPMDIKGRLSPWNKVKPCFQI